MEDHKKNPEQETVDPRVTRRDFIKTAGKVAGITALGLPFVGCGDDSQNPSAYGGSAPNVKSSGISIPNESQTYVDEFDVVVIGTGMGGSAAGAISALNGLKTLILEKNPTPGGSCSYYYKDTDYGKFHVDTGAHMFIQANRGNKGPFHEVTDRLDMPNIDFIFARNTLHAKGINMDFIVPGNGHLLGRVVSVLQILTQTKINPASYPGIIAMLGDIMLMSPRHIEKLDHLPLEEFVYRFTKNEKAREILSGVLGLMVIMPAHQASTGEAIWNLQKLLWSVSVSYPRGGASTISQTFLDGAESYGAEIQMDTGVNKILVNNGKVEGVLLTTGETVKTRAVISTSSAKDTILQFVGEENFPYDLDYVDRIKAIKPSFTAVQAKIGLKKKLVTAGCIAGGTPLTGEKTLLDEVVRTAFEDAAAGTIGKYTVIYAPVPTNFDESLAPEGCQLITAVALAPTLDIDYVDPPQAWVNSMMNTLNQMIPGLDENTIFCDTWDIQKTANWVGKSDGSAISTGQSIDQVGDKRLPHETPIEGLYLAGDCAGPARGVGTELACQSGIDCADLITQHFEDHLLIKVSS